MPLNAQAHFELGLVEFDNFHNYEEALRHFRRACELNPRLAVSWLFAALAALELEQPGSIGVCAGRRRRKDSAAPWYWRQQATCTKLGDRYRKPPACIAKPVKHSPLLLSCKASWRWQNCVVAM